MKKNVASKILTLLERKGEVTKEQVRKKFGIKNVSARISELRKNGHLIYNIEVQRRNQTKSIYVYYGSHSF